jgi:hypothetical protein
LACRAIAVDGDVRIEAPPGIDAGTTPVLLQGLVPTEGWMALGPSARLVAKDPRTARETTFRGPAHARACVAYNEESWLTTGGFDSSVGAGETPGAEEWVVTPFAIVRYSAAQLSVDVRKTDAKVVITTGVGFLWTPDDVTPSIEKVPLTKTDDGWLRAIGSEVLPSSIATTLPGVRRAVARCRELGKEAHDLSGLLLAGGADASTVNTQVATRRLAKAACAVAEVRIASLPPTTPPDASAEVTSGLAEGNAAWTTLATGSGPPSGSSALPPP